MTSLLLALAWLSPAVCAQSPLAEKIKYVERPGPAASTPWFAPNLPSSVVKRFQDAAEEADKHAADPITPEQWERATDAALKALIKELHFPHSSYLTKKEALDMRQRQSGKAFGGIGLELIKDPKGAKGWPIPGNPAERAGIQEGDVVTHIDGAGLADKTLDAIADLIRGPKTRPVTLTVERASAAQPLTFTIQRADVALKHAFGVMIPGTDVGHVHFDQFGDPGVSDAEVLRLIDGLRAQGMRKLVLDLRFNPGGSTRTVGEIASQFLKDKQPIVTYKRQGQVVARGEADGDGRYKDLKLAVLINGGSASASEILSKALKDHRRAVIVGTKSFGKGSAQTIVPVRDDAAVRILSSRWFSPNDESIQGKIDPQTDNEIAGTGGVEPDEVVATTPAEDQALAKSLKAQLYGRPASAPDRALDKAVELLSRP